VMPLQNGQRMRARKKPRSAEELRIKRKTMAEVSSATHAPISPAPMRAMEATTSFGLVAASSAGWLG
jgi:hypothetical protein